MHFVGHKLCHKDQFWEMDPKNCNIVINWADPSPPIRYYVIYGRPLTEILWMLGIPLRKKNTNVNAGNTLNTENTWNTENTTEKQGYYSISSITEREWTSTWFAGKPMVPVLTARLSDANPWKVTGLVSVMPATKCHQNVHFTNKVTLTMSLSYS